MAAASIDTAIRNAVACGASLDHLAILDNFCWCSSYDKSRLAELVGAVRACYDYAVGYGTPFISGKDSMFNDFKGYDEKGNQLAISIPPTLLISAIGVIPDLSKSVTPEFKFEGDIIYVLGETHDELGASEYYKLLSKNDVTKIGINVPKVDWKKNKKTYQALEKAIVKGLVASSISVGSGGLVVALAKSSVGGMLGANVSLKKLSGTFTSADSTLFSESQGRIVVSVAKKNKSSFEKLMKGIPCSQIGNVTKGKKVVVVDKKGKKIINTDVDKLKSTYHKFSDRMK